MHFVTDTWICLQCTFMHDRYESMCTAWGHTIVRKYLYYSRLFYCLKNVMPISSTCNWFLTMGKTIETNAV